MKPIVLRDQYKRGSSWAIEVVRKNPDKSPVDMTGLVTRAMFRTMTVDGDIKFTLDDSDGVVIDDPTNGKIVLKVKRSLSATIPASSRVYFDVEQTSPADPDYEWQSPTFIFVVDEQVTRDD